MRRVTTLLAVFVLIAAACGDDGDPASNPTNTAAAPTTSGATGTSPPTTDTPATSPSAADTTTTTTPSSAPLDVSIVTADGLTLAATVYPGSDNWVVLAHMRPADKESWRDFPLLLQDANFTVLTYNNRGYGSSEGSREPFALITDADAALAYARAQGAAGIVFGGASMNGAAAMVLGASNDFEAIFTLSAVPAFPSVENAADSASGVEEPILFVAAEDDGTAVPNANGFAEVAPNSTLIALGSGGHGTNMLVADPDLGFRIVDWLLAALAS